MAYNKAKAEREWLKWKEAEEKKLRELGVDEETIQRLHTYDWAQFNKERQYLQRQVEWSPYVDFVSAQDLELPVEDTESLFIQIAVDGESVRRSKPAPHQFAANAPRRMCRNEPSLFERAGPRGDREDF